MMAGLRHSHRMKCFANSRAGEDGWRGVALGTVRAVPAVVCMVLADIVLAAEGMFEVPGALVERGTLGAASDAMVHAGRHSVPHFRLREKTSTEMCTMRTVVTHFLITNRGFRK